MPGEEKTYQRIEERVQRPELVPFVSMVQEQQDHVPGDDQRRPDFCQNSRLVKPGEVVVQPQDGEDFEHRNPMQDE